MITAKNTVAEMTDTEFAAQRDMERKIANLWSSYLGANDLYLAMLDKPSLFDLSEAHAQYEVYRKIQTEHDALDDEYSRLYLSGAVEAN